MGIEEKRSSVLEVPQNSSVYRDGQETIEFHITDKQVFIFNRIAARLGKSQISQNSSRNWTKNLGISQNRQWCRNGNMYGSHREDKDEKSQHSSG